MKKSLPVVHGKYDGLAARHIACVGSDFIITTNNNYKVDVFKRGVKEKVKTLEIEYMRSSLSHNNYLFIGTEEKTLYLVNSEDFEI